MNPRLALTVGAVFGFAFGVPLFVVPAAVLAFSGIAASNDAVALSRGAGATLVGLGAIDWLARDAAGKALRGLLVGNLVVQALQLVANGTGLVSGQLPPQAAGATVLHLVLSGIFVLALRTAR
ncbi:MAG TPA: hypothetical protein VJQ09_05655 [Candidatus Limnocylindria bacterium]|nr:hypothetical protein [Candidatus Limnocylindria bacterium]